MGKFTPLFELLLFVALLCPAVAKAQPTGQWIWAADDTAANTPGVYGTKGVAAPGNRPCGRDSYATCTDSAGNFWLFGGKDKNGNLYSDLWKFNPFSRQWTWVDGPSTPNYHSGSETYPGGRYGSVMVMDHKGTIWIFGGYGYSYLSTQAYMMELWVYQPANVSGNGKQVFGILMSWDKPVYGTQGTPSNANIPGPRAYSWITVDAQNDLWVFGGYGLDANGNYGLLNDLWEFTPTNGQTYPTWTWVSGDNFANSLGTAYLPGQENYSAHPSGRQQFVGGMDPRGNIWIFGGDGIYQTGDLWMYDMSTGEWDWVGGGFDAVGSGSDPYGSYGQKGVASPSNVPQGRSAACGGVDAAGNFWVYGGYGYGTNMENVPGYGYVAEANPLNDLWEYTPASGNWTWIAGDSTTNHSMIASAQGTMSANNNPGGRDSAGAWMDRGGNLWLMGGLDSLGNDRNDIWQFNTTLLANTQLTGPWTWVGGDSSKNNSGIYGHRLLASLSNQPGSRDGHSGWADASNNFYVFGGNGYGSSGTKGYLNDLWYGVSSSGQREWSWAGGDSTLDQRGDYGTEGTGSLATTPGARSGQASCSDRSGNYWIFGGNGYDATGVSGGLGDLWESKTGSRVWTWVGGSKTANQTAVYGTLGTAAAANQPGYRAGAVLAVDPSGTVWLFGGNGIDGSGKTGDLNDLWEYTPANKQWTWVSGSSSVGAATNYSPGGVPGAREYGSAFADRAGNIWTFGGYATGKGYLSDLWEYSPTAGSWTWIAGNNTPNYAGVYGTWGVPSPTNLPGGREMQGSLVDQAGNFWMYGGKGYDEDGNLGTLGDLWEYTPSLNEWTWISGDSSVAAAPVYGSKGTSNAAGKPGARQSFAFWLDKAGSLWIMGGLDYEGQDNNDLWQFKPTSVVTLPIQNVTLEGTPGNQENLLTWQTLGELNTLRFGVERSTDGANFSTIVNVPAIGSGNNSYSYPDNQLPASNVFFYRLSMVDANGDSTWSQTIELNAATTSRGLILYPNPAHGSVTLQLQDNSLLNSTLRLLDLNGRLLRQQMITAKQETIDLTNLARGIYLLQLANGAALKILKE